jgi:hypothetical protein
MSKIIVIGGGTFSFIRNHLALAAPAFGTTAANIAEKAISIWKTEDSLKFYLTHMADPHVLWGEQDSPIVSNEDVEKLVEMWKADFDVKVVFFNVAMCDFRGSIVDENFKATPSGKYKDRLHTSEGNQIVILEPAEKIISTIREGRKDIYVVGFKTTCGQSKYEMYNSGVDMLKRSFANLVLVNDSVSRKNMIVTPQRERLCYTDDRDAAILELVKIAYERSEKTSQTIEENIPFRTVKIVHSNDAEELLRKLKNKKDYDNKGTTV